MIMRSLKTPLVVVGWASLSLGIALLVWSIYLASNSNLVERIPLSTKNLTEEVATKVDTSNHVQLALELDLEGSETYRDEKGKYHLLYELPVTYTVISHNTQIHQQQIEISNNKGFYKSYSNKEISHAGGSLSITTTLDKFRSSSSDLSINIEIRSDERYETKVKNANVLVYDNVSVHYFRVPLGLLLLILGYLSKKIGSVMFTPESPRERLVCLLLCFFVGFLGAHRFYVGRPITGTLQVLTLGGLGLWSFVDLICITVGGFTDGEQRRLLNWINSSSTCQRKSSYPESAQ